MDNNKIKQMLAAANGANHVGEYPSGSYSPMPNRVGSVHAVSDLQEILSLRAQVEQLQKDKAQLELSVFDQRRFIEMPAAVVPVFNEIAKEIEYQNEKWGEQHNRNQTVEGHLLILEEELLEARKGWAKNLTGRNSVESEITQIAAVAIQALINLHNAGRL